MSESFHIRVCKSELAFSAAHFITIGNHCERLHGHNYHVAAEVSGPLDANHLVVDFLFVRDTLRSLVSELDHYMLLPTVHPMMRVEQQAGEVVAHLNEKRWVFPAGDCRLLPLANTTAELLAAYLGKRLAAALNQAGVSPTRLRLELDECDGQIAAWQQ